MSFIPGYKASRGIRTSDYVFLFRNHEILVSSDRVPALEEAAALVPEPEKGIYIGTVDTRNCYIFSISGNETLGDDPDEPAGGQVFVNLRQYIAVLNSDLCAAAYYASHVINWEVNSRFCGRCGAVNSWYDKERARCCGECGRIEFPRISPAIIIGIQKEDKILLAHNSNFPEGRYSLLAGFVEIGETIEEAAAREVKEETGIEIENIKYLCSQSWPFPDSLMIGLMADYKSGEIVPDGEEILHADWFTPETFPSIPGQGTISRKIIDRYTETYKS